MPDFWLGSRELTAWAVPRACHSLGPVEVPSGAGGLLVRLDPPGPTGEHVIVTPRYRGDSLDSAPEAQVVVNVLRAPDGLSPGDSLAAEELEHVGVGELAATEAAARAGLEAMDAQQFGAGAGAWEPIAGFRGPGEYERFKRWLAGRVADGTAQPVPADLSRTWTTSFEDWYRNVETGEIWSLFHPDPPSTGGFERVEGGRDPSDSG